MDADRDSPCGMPSGPENDPTAVAARWIARRNAGLTFDQRRQLSAWLTASPENARAFSAADKSRTELDWPLHAGALDEVLAGLEQRATRRRRQRHTMLSLGVATALVVGAALLVRDPAPHSREAPAPARSLVVKAPDRETLPDGTTVDLKEGAEITTDFSNDARRVTLLRGTAHFQVTKSARPFIVSAAGITAQALGTAFAVEFDGKNVSVLVAEGRVAVNKQPEVAVSPPDRATDAPPPEPLAILEAGKSVSVSVVERSEPVATAVATVAAAEVENRLSWRIPRLEFSGTRLADVVAILNRYNRQQFVIAERSLEDLELSGVLRADRVDALVAMLESDFKVKAERREGQIILQR